MKTRILNLAVLVVAGLAGGALSNVVLRGGPAVAQGDGIAPSLYARSFTLVDPDGHPRAALRTMLGSPSLTMSDRNGRTRAELSMLVDGRPQLILSDGAGQPRMKLAVASDGTPSVALLAKGTVRAEMIVEATGTPSLLLRSPEGARTVELSDYESGPVVFLMGAQGGLLWRAP